MVGRSTPISRKEFIRRTKIPSGAVKPRPGGGFTPISRQEFRRRGGGGGIAEQQRAIEEQKKVEAKRISSVTKPRRGGGTVTVTKSGKVTERDIRGKLIRQFQTTSLQAAQFILTPPTQAQRIVRDIIRTGGDALIGRAGEIITIDSITGRQTVQDPSRLRVTKTGRIGVAPGKVLAKIPRTARAFAPVIRKRIQERERREVKEEVKARQDIKTQTGKFTPFAINQSLSASAIAAIRKDQANLKKFFTKPPISEIRLDPAEAAFRALDKKPFLGIPGLGGRPTPREQLIKDIEKFRRKTETKRLRTSKVSALERQLTGVIIQPSIAIGIGVTAVLTLIRHPFKTIRGTIKAFSPSQIKGTVTEEVKRFINNPLAVITEYVTFIKILKFMGRSVRNTPLAQTVAEEAFIASQPKTFRPAIKTIIRADRIQRIINPTDLATVKNFQVFKPLTMNLIEFKATVKTISQTNSVLFGSGAGKALQRKALVPHDLDIATTNIQTFYRQFLKNLPKNQRKNYVLKGQKIFRKGQKQPLFDIKPLSRLIPQRSILSRTGRLPVAGIKEKIKITKLTKKNLLNLKKGIKKNIKELRELKPRNIKERSSINRIIKTNRQLLRLATRKGLKSKKVLTALKDIGEIGRLSLPRLEKELRIRLTVPTQRLVRIKTPVGEIKAVSFAEQTTRKALGVLQLIIEKEVRRAKDPSGLLVNLKIQRDFLKSQKPLSTLGKRRIKILDRAIRLLGSKVFANLIKRRTGIINQFPVLKKINLRNLRKINLKNVNKRVRAKLREVVNLAKRVKQLSKRLKTLRKKKPRTKGARLRLKKSIDKVKAEINKIRLRLKKTVGQETLNKAGISKLPKFKPSRIPALRPSRIPKLKPSRLPKAIPSKLPKVRPSKLPVSRLPSALRGLSKIPSIIPVLIPISKIPPSRIPSRLVPSRIPISRIPKPKISKLPIPKTFVPPPPQEKIIIEEAKKKKKLKRLSNKVIQKQTFIFIADLYSRIYGIFANPKEKRAFLKVGRVFTGAEARLRIRGRR